MPNDGFLPQTSHTLAMTHTSELAGLKPEDRFASCEPAPWNKSKALQEPEDISTAERPQISEAGLPKPKVADDHAPQQAPTWFAD